MGLSSDPEKRANQLRNLSGGWPRAAHKHGLVKPEPQPADPPEDTEPEPPEPAEPDGTLEVVDYHSDPQPEPRPEPKPRPARQRKRPAEPAAEPDPPAQQRGGFLSDFKAGFFGD